MCIYIYNNNNYFMLIINDAHNKRVCKKVFGFNISLFKKCYSQYFHNIVNCRYSNIFDSFNIFIDTMPHTQPNLFPFLFVFLFFLPFSLNQKSQPYTFCNTQLNSRVKKKKGRGGGGVRYFKEPHV